jgi:hypothetical protein
VLLINEQGRKKMADMNSLGVVLSPGGWLARTGAKASEASRSAVQRKPKRAPIRSVAHGRTQK